MKHARNILKVGLLALLCAAGVAGLSSSAHAAQEPQPVSSAGSATAKSLPLVNLDLRDAPIRSALEQLFNTVKADFAIDPTVQGFVTLKMTDKPFENALRLVMRSASVPLTYSVEDGVYIIRPRRIERGAPGVAGPSSLPADPPTFAAVTTDTGRRMETITLTYMDPYDLKDILGITIIPVGTRGGNVGLQGGIGGGGGANSAGLPGATGANGIGGTGSTGNGIIPRGGGSIFGN